MESDTKAIPFANGYKVTDPKTGVILTRINPVTGGVLVIPKSGNAEYFTLQEALQHPLYGHLTALGESLIKRRQAC